MKARLLAGLLLGIILNWGVSVNAQSIMPFASMTITYAEVLQVASNTNEYSATALVFANIKGKHLVNHLTLMVSGDHIRTEFRLCEFAPPNIPEPRLKIIASMDSDEVVAIYHADKDSCDFLFPRMKAACQITVPKSLQELHDEMITNKIVRTVIGHEMIKENPCRKIQVRDNCPNPRTTAIIWENEKNNQPVCLQIGQTNDLVNLNIYSFVAGKPDAAQFEIPAGYTNYSSLTNILMEARKRLVLRR